MPPTKTDRILAFQAETRTRCADSVRDAAFGRVIETPSLPFVFSLNAAEVTAAGADVDEVVAAAPAVPRPSLLVKAEADVPRFARALERWDADHELTMLLREPPEAPPEGSVREGTREETMALLNQWLLDDYAEQGPDALAQLSVFMERQQDARPTRRFVSPDASAMTLLWSDGTTAQVEDVYTRADARGRGHARALVAHVARLAHAEGHDEVFLVADADDTPQELYRRLGFEDLVRAARFTRRPQSADS